MQNILESISAHIQDWGKVWFGLIFWGSIFNELLSFNPFQAMDSNINIFSYLLGLSLGLVAKFRGRWI
jgi:hypothetical protein